MAWERNTEPTRGHIDLRHGQTKRTQDANKRAANAFGRTDRTNNSRAHGAFGRKSGR